MSAFRRHGVRPCLLPPSGRRRTGVCTRVEWKNNELGHRFLRSTIVWGQFRKTSAYGVSIMSQSLSQQAQSQVTGSQPVSAPVILRLAIKHYRGIKALAWRPGTGLNLILGGGDVGKTTILDAVALLLSPTNPATLSDTDYYGRKIEEGFEIEAVMTLPPGERNRLSVQTVVAVGMERNGRRCSQSRRRGDPWRPCLSPARTRYARPRTYLRDFAAGRHARRSVCGPAP